MIEAWGKEFDSGFKKKIQMNALWTLGKTIRFRVTCYSDGVGKYHYLTLSPTGHLSCDNHDSPGFRGCFTLGEKLSELKLKYESNYGTEEQQAKDPEGLIHSSCAIYARERYERSGAAIKAIEHQWKPVHESIAEDSGCKNSCREVQLNWLNWLRLPVSGRDGWGKNGMGDWSSERKRHYECLHPLLQHVAKGRLRLSGLRAQWKRNIGYQTEADYQRIASNPIRKERYAKRSLKFNHRIPESDLRVGFRRDEPELRRHRLLKGIDKNLKRCFSEIGKTYYLREACIDRMDWFRDVAMKGLDFPFYGWNPTHDRWRDHESHRALFSAIAISSMPYFSRFSRSNGLCRDGAHVTFLVAPNLKYVSRSFFLYTATVNWHSTGQNKGYFYFHAPIKWLNIQGLAACNPTNRRVTAENKDEYVLVTTEQHTRKSSGMPGSYQHLVHPVAANVGPNLRYIEFGIVPSDVPTVLQRPAFYEER